MMKNYVPILLILFLFVFPLRSQEVRILTVSDYDLNGKVKTCLVITDYGRELFEFNETGLLTKTVTQYNESDQDITLYKYKGGELVEKRMESYKNNVLDEATSMANFYTLDTIPRRRIVEKIISYDKDFLEQQEYQYNDFGQLTKIVTSSAGGVDETTFEYTPYKDELTKSIFNNGILEKSVRTSQRKTKDRLQKVLLTKEFIDGEPNTAQEEIFDDNDNLISKELFLYDLATKKFASQNKQLHYYSEGVLQKVVTETATTKSVEEYIFQFDSSPAKNWVKQIITPGNSYTTRVINYYPEDKVAETPNN
ncbi:hypothetical protein GTQ34_04400 [Muricauda sp. JGD-17]|uniref:YD repeat-containing protein n=1 Tax=Flagellimonas ochracea TaxID=2696472 RepID=A0A964TAB3_9FLAO|nr:hypothetical protein [Allomuricauda ochracea]NAY91153.1 hypothetical protein [Allomuricauda ochracea]